MKQDVINLCIAQGAVTIRDVNDMLLAFVRECGGFNSLPKKFTLTAQAMKTLEDDIEQAIVDGDLQKTEDLCDEYKSRFTTFIDGWRARINKLKEAAV